MSQPTRRHPIFTRADEFIVRRDYESGMKLVETALADPDDRTTAIDLLSFNLLKAECLAFTGRHDMALSISEAAIDSLCVGDDHDLYARACFISAVAFYHLGDIDRAYEVGNLGLYASKRIGDTIGVIKALNWLGNVVFYKSEFGQAITFYTECAKTAMGADYPQFAAVANGNIARTMILSGQLREAREYFMVSREGLEGQLHRLSILRNQLSVSFLGIQMRDFDSAAAILTKLESEIFATCHLREQGAWCEYIAELELARGEFDAAASHLTQGIELASRGAHDESVIGQSRRLLAEVRLAQADYYEATAESERALQSIRQVGERFEEGVVYRILGEARLRIGQRSESRAAFKQSIDILRDIGACLEWAKSCLAAGRCDIFSRRERLAYLVEAERLFAAIGVEYWNDQTQRELNKVLQDREDEIQTRHPEVRETANTIFVTANRESLEIVRLAERLARTDIAILLTGETGVGKDQLSRHIHAVSPRHAAPFMPIDLSVLPDTLWESEIFGHRKGTFTGAASDKIGLLESANGGTVFLNEIGNLPLAFQSKLLELLDSKKIRRLGETDSRSLDIRFIAATNVDLPEAVAQGRFRSDLYYRLAQAPLHVKPLRERREDIIPMLRHFLLEFGVPPSDLGLLERQLWVERAHNGHWAGNVRQLRSFVHRLVAIAERPSDSEFPVWAERLLEQIDIIHEPNVGGKLSPESLSSALERNLWNQRATARDLGITEGGVRHLMRSWGIQRPD